MYLAHFGLSEAPFSITPDPRYLYMSEGHREALAHLLYGVGEGGGFVQLTGEVGTGKTTVCRCLLEQLPPHVDVALVLNPKLTAIELLATVCDELRLPYPEGTTSVKTLVDALDRHLLEAHARGRRTALVIDEAQNLSGDVLEQIRLLTNLETTRDKLLQIVLIGQPELARLLARPELRQVAQRVTARYHLAPFSPGETRAYVRHRLEVAGGRSGLISDGALRLVHRLSGGVPRLINIICDRALLGAYAEDRRSIDAATVRRAAREVVGRGMGDRRRRTWRWAAAGAAAAALVATGGVLLGRESAGLVPGGPRAASVIASPVAGTDPPADGLAVTLADPGLRADRETAFAALLERSGVTLAGDSPSRPTTCAALREHGLACLSGAGTWSRLRRYARPALVTLSVPDAGKRHAVVTSVDSARVTLDVGGTAVTAALAEADRLWDGGFVLIWKPPEVRVTLVEPGRRGRDVAWLRQRIARIDGEPAGTDRADVYDDDLRRRVVAFQRARGLTPDGIVGEETLVHLTMVEPR